MVKMVVMTVWIRPVGWWEGENQDVNEAYGKNDRVYSKGGVLHVEKNGL